MAEQLGEGVSPPPPQAAPEGAAGRPRFRVGAVVALALAAGIAAWVIVGRHDSTPSSTASTSNTSASTAPSGPVANPIPTVALSADALQTLAKTVGQPIYWRGPKQRFTYELTRTASGRVFVRYLPRGVKAGAPGAHYLIIATYPFPNALRALKAVSLRGAQRALPGGGIAVVDQAYPKSVHIAYPNVDYQVEVYDPSPKVALQVATSGKVRPVR
jgi:hypothetical protein